VGIVVPTFVPPLAAAVLALLLAPDARRTQNPRR
jgi:uncharacterized membrane protein